MIRLNETQLRDRVAMVEDVMSLEGSSYNLDTGEVLLQSRIGAKATRKPNKTTQGYLYYTLRGNGKSNTVYLHHIVMILADAELYINQMTKGMTINHISGDKADNRLSNLEYLTSLDNILHAYVTGLTERPVDNFINEYEAYHILEGFYQQGKSLEELSDVYLIPVGTVKRIVMGKAHQAMFAMFKAVNKTDVIRKSGANRLTASNVKIILRDYYIKGKLQQEIADRYKVSRSTIGMITTGKRWQEIYKEFTEERA